MYRYDIDVNKYSSVASLIYDLEDILNNSIEELDDVEGIGEIRATYIKNGLIKMKQLVLLDRHI